jgi:hypothetical protein
MEKVIPPPNHLMPEKSIWIDPQQRTIIVWRIWTGNRVVVDGKANPSTVEFLVLTTAEAMTWITLTWEQVYELIVTKKMQRCHV